MPGPLRQFEFAASPGRWQLVVAPPAPDLAGVVKEFWEVRGELAPFREKVLPNGALELMVNLGPRHHLITQQGASAWDHSWFSGLHEQSIVIESPSGTHLVSARLHPLGARELFGEAAPASVNRVVDLREFLGTEAEELRTALVAAPDAAARFELLETLLRNRLGGTEVPAFVRAASTRIESAHGRLRISDLHAGLGVSRKHLAVSFVRAIGIAAKAYASIHRFAWTAARLQASTSVDWSQLSDEAGYADQSHLVRDFQRVAQANPTVFLRQQTPDGSALIVG
jgi:AraC-like DNA-binding protein